MNTFMFIGVNCAECSDNNGAKIIPIPLFDYKSIHYLTYPIRETYILLIVYVAYVLLISLLAINRVYLHFCKVFAQRHQKNFYEFLLIYLCEENQRPNKNLYTCVCKTHFTCHYFCKQDLHFNILIKEGKIKNVYTGGN